MCGEILLQEVSRPTFRAVASFLRLFPLLSRMQSRSQRSFTFDIFGLPDIASHKEMKQKITARFGKMDLIYLDVEMQMDFTCQKGRNMFLQRELYKEPSDILARIPEYSARTRTFENDALNAILGVLRTFDHIQYPKYHY